MNLLMLMLRLCIWCSDSRFVRFDMGRSREVVLVSYIVVIVNVVVDICS